MVNYSDIKDKTVEELCAIALAYLKAEEPDDALRVASFALEQDVNNPKALFIVGNVFLETGKEPIAEHIFRKVLEITPMKGEVWGSVGRSIDAYRRPEEAFKYLKRAHELKPKATAPMINLANAYCVAGMYKESLYWAQKVIDIKPDSASGNDNHGMARLGLGDFTGFDGTNYGLGGKYRPETQYGDEERWDGTKNKTVIVCGEQGLGDEIIYGSCIPDLIKDSKEVIIDCDHRLESLFKRSFPKASVYGTRRCTADWPHNHTWDARIAVGSLPMFYRRKEEDFPGTPFLVADPVRRKQWRLILDELSDRPKVGIAWSGGVKLTGRHLRSTTLDMFKPLLEDFELIDLSHEKKDYDLPIHQWDHATLTGNYDDTAGLVAELDFVVTVCTSIVHLAGGLGVPTYVLTPERPSWRYSLGRMPWYNSVELIPYKDSWENSIQSAIQQIKEFK